MIGLGERVAVMGNVTEELTEAAADLEAVERLREGGEEAVEAAESSFWETGDGDFLF